MRAENKPLMAIWGAMAILLTPVTGQLHAQNAAPDATTFSIWAERYRAETNPRVRSAMAAEGVTAARQRRALLKSLIASDPRAALALSRSLTNAAGLPPEIQRELETSFNTTGDFIVEGAVAAKGGPPVEPLRRFVRLGTRIY